MDGLKECYYELFRWYGNQLLAVVSIQNNLLVFGIILPKEKDLYSCLVPKSTKERGSVCVVDIREYFGLHSLDDAITHEAFQRADLLFNNSSSTLKNALYKNSFLEAKEKWTSSSQTESLNIIYEFARQVIDKFNGRDPDKDENQLRAMFASTLTKKESHLYKDILDKYFDGGKKKSTDLVVTQVCIDCDVSRPVVKNLFTKMEKGKIANISSHGMNGTNIVFLINNLELMEIPYD